jgi:phenylalanyl-tRNA synthetase beta chain
MKISLNWLKELCPTSLSATEVAARLTAAGLEIEGREERGLPVQTPAPGAPAGVVAAKVLVRAPIAGSDHLSLCDVDDGTQVWKVVCGADNYAAGDVVPLARIGAVLPGGMVIKQAKLRGNESSGMLCSARELGLSDDHAGLLHLSKDAKLGASVESLLGLPDTVFEVNVTPNRPDALSHLGVARELAALLGTALHTPAPALGAEKIDAAAPVHAKAKVEIQDTARCTRYLARVIEGVKIGPSPLELQERLRACGVRAISNVVDATNLALLELGHPLHAFDLDKLRGERIVVRRAAEGEVMKTLDGQERACTSDDLLICDGERPVALAGVMGGLTSEVSDGTVRVLLESAWFEPSGIRRTSKRLGLKTEASIRFEKGADEQGARLALDRCAELIAQLAGGQVVPGVIDVFPAPRPLAQVTVRPARVSSVLGAEITAAECEQRLSSLGLVQSGGTAEARQWTVPSWRRDLTREIDCIEEVARQRGLDSIPVVQHAAAVGETQVRSAESIATSAIRAQLSGRGFHEALNYSFVAEADLLALAAGNTLSDGAKAAALARPIRVANPLASDQGAMRTSTLPGLLRNLQRNLAHGAPAVQLYELGRVYLPWPDPRHPSGKLAWPVAEPTALGMVSFGSAQARFWGDPVEKAAAASEGRAFFELKGSIEELCATLGLSKVTFRPATQVEAPFLHPAAAAALLLGDGDAGVVAGVFGQLHPLVAHHFDVPAAAVVAELWAAELTSRARPAAQSHGIPRFPAVSRDLAFLVDAGLAADGLLAEIRGADAKGLLEAVELFDLYRGAQIPSGKKSLAFGLRLRAADRTLTDAEADALVAAVVARLKAVGAEMRA